MKDTSSKPTGRLALRPHQTVSISAAPGTVVRGLEGTVWLTQEALLADCILIPGTRFVSASRGKIVLSALDGAAVARVYAPECDTRLAHIGTGLQFDPGVLERIEKEARRAQAQEIGRLLRLLGDFVSSAWRSIKAKGGRRKAEGTPAVSPRGHVVASH
jgi:hypothetical protein